MLPEVLLVEDAESRDESENEQSRRYDENSLIYVAVPCQIAKGQARYYQKDIEECSKPHVEESAGNCTRSSGR